MSVDERSRKKFESDWRAGRANSIDEYLPQDDSIQYLATLEELVCIEMEFRWNRESKGTSVTPDADTVNDLRPPYVEDYTRRFSSLREPAIVERLAEHEIEVRRGTKWPPTEAEYKRRFPTLTFSQRRFQPRTGTAGSSLRSGKKFQITEQDLPRWFGRFQLTAVLGRGGMATVYRATQHNADRDVAVKIADPAAAQSRSEEFRQRFLTEAKAAAQLAHDHIVPVYDVGEVDGQPYYSMPIVDGGDLSSLIGDGPLAPKTAAKHIYEAARGVAAAHAVGVLHRDLKPSNLMIDRVRQRTLVTDFGLAREIATGSVGDSGESVLQLTRTGQVLGTPPYMAPEQIRDARTADMRSDVYSLGATLYQCVTGRPPFQASTPTETLLQVMQAYLVPPRHLNDTIDRDLETIVLKSLDRDPHKRYATANDFADDLQRYMNDEPILGRRIGKIEQFRRWCRRNQKVAALSGLLFIATLSALAATIIGLAVAYNNSLTILDEQAYGLEQNKQFIATLAQSRSTLDAMYTQLSTDPVFTAQPGQAEVRRKLLQRSVKHYQSFIAIASNNRVLLPDVATTRVRLATMHLEMDGPEIALAEFKNAIGVFAKLTPEQRQLRDVRLALSDAHNGVGQSLMQLGDYAAANKAFEQAESIRIKLTQDFSRDGEVHRKRANATMNRGLALGRLNQLDQAMTLLQQSQTSRQQLLKNHGDDQRLRLDMGQGAFGLARMFADLGNADRSYLHLDQATEVFRAIRAESPNDGMNYLRLLRCRLLRATVAYEHADQIKGDEAMRGELEDFETFAQMSKYNLAYRLELVDVYLQGTRTLLQRQRFKEAERTSQSVDQLLTHDVSTSEQAERSKRVLRARLIHRSQQAVLLLAKGDDAGRQMLVETLKKWEEVRGRFVNDRELAAEMQDLAALLAPDPV